MSAPPPPGDGVPFLKMHGLGNDYVYVDEVEVELPAGEAPLWARRLADRHRGVGGDGLIVVRRDPEHACRMEMYNADGSRAQMCGNGMRCVAAIARWRGYATASAFSVGSDSGPRAVEVETSAPGRARVRVDMGVPREVGAPEAIPLSPGRPLPSGTACEDRQRREVVGRAVDVGNPHFVLRLPAGSTIEDAPVSSLGPLLEGHPRFPERTNVAFASVRSRREIDLRVWERGAGETRACGTGAVAAVAALQADGEVGERVTVHLPGGDLDVGCDGAGAIWQEGPAVLVFRGTVDRAWLDEPEEVDPARAV